MATPAPDPSDSLTSTGYDDGLGRRTLAFDRAAGVALERLILRGEFTAFEAPLREAAADLSSFDDERIARVRDVHRDPVSGALVVDAEYVPGDRLSDILEAAAQARDDVGPPGVDVALGFLLDVLPALAAMHTATGRPHGALSPGRVVFSAAGQVILLDTIFAAVLQRLRLTRARLWRDFGIAMPAAAGAPRFNVGGDLAQASLTALMLVLGRSLTDADYASGFKGPLGEVVEIAEIRGSGGFASQLDAFFRRALPQPGGLAFASADEALAQVESLVAGIAPANCRAALGAFVQQIRQLPPPAPPPRVEATPAAAPAAVRVEPARRDVPTAPIERVASPVVSSPTVPAPFEPPRPAIATAPSVVAPPVAVPPADPAPPLAVSPPLVVPPARVVAPPVAVTPAIAPQVHTEPAAPAASIPAPIAVEVPTALPPPPPAPPPLPEPAAAPADVQAAPVVPAPAPLADVESPPQTPAPPVPSPRQKGKRRGGRDRLRSASVTVPASPTQPPPRMPVFGEGAAPPASVGVAPAAASSYSGAPVSPGWTAPTAGIAVLPATPFRESPGGAVRLKSEPPSGYSPRASSRGPRPDEHISAIPYVPRGTGGSRPSSRWTLAAAAVVVLGIGAFAGWPYLPQRQDVFTAGGSASTAAPAPRAATGGTLVLTSQPDGARVLIDGQPAGETPLTLQDVQPGRRVVTFVSTAGTVKRTVRVAAGETATLDVPVFSGWVAVSSPIVLDVAENGRPLGNTRENRLLLAPGRHVLSFSNRALGYSSTQAVEIESGEERKVVITPTAPVNLNASPWAEVWIDGQRAGETPLANLQVPLGTREFVFKHPQFGERRITETVTMRGPGAISVDFQNPGRL